MRGVARKTESPGRWEKPVCPEVSNREIRCVHIPTRVRAYVNMQKTITFEQVLEFIDLCESPDELEVIVDSASEQWEHLIEDKADEVKHES